jgi:cation diffusion facilitator family transporter
MPSPVSPVDAGELSHAEEHAALRGAPVRIAAISLFVTACLLALKLSLGLLSGSIAVLSDAVDSGTDLVGGAAALFSIQISRRPEDEEHPYGHGKIEAVSAAVAATVIGLGGGLVTYQAVRRLIEGSPEIHVGIGLIAMSVAAVANVVTAFFMRREARRAHSMALGAEATHLTTNIVQASAIIAGLLLVQFTGKVFFDPLTALALAAYMAWIARGLVLTALGEVMDTTLPPEDLRAIQAALAAHESEIRGYHRLRTRRSGATRHIDMHLLFDASRTVHEVHEVSDHVSDEIHRRLPGSIVVIHVEPEADQSA